MEHKTEGLEGDVPFQLGEFLASSREKNCQDFSYQQHGEMNPSGQENDNTPLEHTPSQLWKESL